MDKSGTTTTTSSPKKFYADFMMAGVAGAISKSTVAPIERVKLLLQNQGEMVKRGKLNTPYKGIGDCFKRVLREEGLFSFWRGNQANIIRYFPTQDLSMYHQLSPPQPVISVKPSRGCQSLPLDPGVVVGLYSHHHSDFQHFLYHSLVLLLLFQSTMTAASDDSGCAGEDSDLLYCDNLSTIYMTSNLVFHARTKHIELDYHFVRERIVYGSHFVRFLPSINQTTDIFTKGLHKHRFQLLRSKLVQQRLPNLRGSVRASL